MISLVDFRVLLPEVAGFLSLRIFSYVFYKVDCLASPTSIMGLLFLSLVAALCMIARPVGSED